MTRLKAAKRLRHPADVKLFVQILVMILTLPRQIRRKSLPDLLCDIDPGVADINQGEAVMLRTVRIVDLLLEYRILQRYGRCFLRSLTLFKFLRRQGWPVEISFGVRREGDSSNGLSGHSWLVLNGEKFLEAPGEKQYFTTYRYPLIGDEREMCNNSNH